MNAEKINLSSPYREIFVASRYLLACRILLMNANNRNAIYILDKYLVSSGQYSSRTKLSWLYFWNGHCAALFAVLIQNWNLDISHFHWFSATNIDEVSIYIYRWRRRNHSIRFIRWRGDKYGFLRHTLWRGERIKDNKISECEAKRLGESWVNQ